MADAEGESLAPLLVAPSITTPPKSSAVNPHFRIEANGPPSAHSWRLEIMFGGSKRHTFHPDSSVLGHMWFNVPENAIPPGVFWFQIDYKIGLLRSAWGQSGNMTMRAPKPPRPTITSPVKNAVVWDRRPVVSGRGVSGATVTLHHQNMGNLSLGSASVDMLGGWQISATASDLWQADPFVFNAIQRKDGGYEWSDLHPVTVLFKPVITTITVTADGKPTISGTGGLKDATLEIYFQGGAGGVQLNTTVRSDGTWSTGAFAPWTAGKHTITAKQIGKQTGRSSDWADSKEVVVKPPKLVITQPTSPIESGQAIRGTGYYPGAKLTLIRGGVALPGTFTNNGAQWTFTPNAMMPATWTITAEQTFGGATSNRSDPVTFNIVPYPPVITGPAQNSTITQNQVINGNRTIYWETTLTMLEGSGTEVPGRFSQTYAPDYTWSFTPSPGLPPGTRTFKVIQTVNGVPSAASAPRTFKVKPPTPVVDTPAFNATTEPRPSTSGTGMRGATVTLSVGGNVVLSRIVDSDGKWQGVVTTDLPGGPCAMSAVQTIDGVSSDPAVRNFKVKPPKPAITGPTTPTPPRPTFSGTGHDGATVNVVQQSHSTPILATATVRSGTWSAALNEGISNLPAGPYPLSARQLVGGVPSDWTPTFEIKVKPPTPEIARPPNPATMRQALTVTNVYSGIVTPTLRNGFGNPIDGDFDGTGTSRTFTPSQDWGLGDNTVRAVQTVNSVESDRSDALTFKVVPPNPEITQPPSPAATRQALTVTNVYPGIVTLKLLTAEGRPVGGDFDGTGTSRTFTPSQGWDSGENTVRVVQTAGRDSQQSDPITFKARPPTPAIATPPNPAAARQELTITGVYSGTVSLEMLNEKDAKVDGTFRTSGIDRIFTPTDDWPLGTNTVRVVQTVDGVASDPSELCTFTVSLSKPSIIQPNIPIEATRSVTITGVASGAVTLEMLNAEGTKIDGTFKMLTIDYTFTPDPAWMPGERQIKVVQKVDGWDPVTSDVVTILIRPPRPTIASPSEPIETTMPLEISDVVSDAASLSMQTATGTPVKGSFSPSGEPRTFTPDPPWVPGTLKVKSFQAVDGVISFQSNVATLMVKPPKPTITPPPNPAAARQELSVTEVYSGIVTLKLLTAEGRPVGGDFDGTGTSRTFTPSQEWDSGENTVKAIQAVNGVDSDPSDECTFTVAVEEKPETPYFVLPETGFQTPTRPTIRVIGLPSALMTVRLEGSETLHSDTANAEGVLEFVAPTPLVPGPNALQVKQQQAGPESDWSESHTFTVKELPKIPKIDAPTDGSRTPRKPTIRGKGESRGQIRLRHTDDPEKLIDTINGATSWRWEAKDSWDIGTYTIEVQQTDDGDSSTWTQPRTFEVVDALFGIGDAGPVLAQPVVSNHESVLLRVQVVSGETGAVVEGVEVEWRIVGEQAVKAITVTDPLGWARYLYTPDTAGEHTVVADLTHENQGVEITQRFEVTALTDDAWAQEFELYLEGEKVDLAKGDLALLRGKTYELELKVKNGSLLIGSSVTLQDLSEAEALGLRFVPPLGAPQPLEEGQSVRWSITSDTGKSGYFGLKLTGPRLPDWQLPGRVIAQDLSEDVDVHFDNFARVFGGAPAYPCIGATHTLTVQPKAQSLLLGKEVILEVTEEAEGLGVIVSPEPNIPQTLGADGVGWTFNCVNSTKSGSFSVRLRVLEWDLSSLALPMLLGNNKVKVVDSDGPREIGGTGERWRTGVCVASAFTEKVVEVPVTVRITGKEPSLGKTDNRGWIYIFHDADESVIFTFHNLYDGSTA